MPHCSAKYYSELFYFSFRRNFRFPAHKGSCRTTIQNVAHEQLKDFILKLASTGGILRQNPQISTRLKTYGTNLKDYLRGVIKPSNKQELINGILTFWESVDEHKCSKYIGHLKKVIATKSDRK